MDYKYIEQLLERYWEAETTQAEEAILMRFFQQTDVPQHLAPYRPLFVAQANMAKAELSGDFDERVMAAIATATPSSSAAATMATAEGTAQPQPAVKTKARRITWLKQLSPLYKAVAVVAVVLTLGNAVQYGWQTADTSEATLLDYQYSDYKDTYSDDKSAYEVASQALDDLSVSLRAKTDTAQTEQPSKRHAR